MNSLTNIAGNLNSLYAANRDIVPGYLNAGFTGIITAYEPWGNSTYQGWANQLTRRFANGLQFIGRLQFIGTYTLSHNIDDSTAEVFSTYVTPRRPQDARNVRPDRSSSSLDRRKNVVGNWEIAPVYTYQTGTLATVQSGKIRI